MDWTMAIGVDTHKEVHVAVAVDAHGAQLDSRKVPATLAGYRSLLSWAQELGVPDDPVPFRQVVAQTFTPRVSGTLGWVRLPIECTSSDTSMEVSIQGVDRRCSKRHPVRGREERLRAATVQQAPQVPHVRLQPTGGAVGRNGIRDRSGGIRHV